MARHKIKLKNSIILLGIPLLLIIFFIFYYVTGNFINDMNKIRRLFNKREIKEFSLLNNYGLLEMFKRDNINNICDAEIYFTKGYEQRFVGNIHYTNKDYLSEDDMVNIITAGENNCYSIYILKCNEVISEKDHIYRNIPIPIIADEKSLKENAKNTLIDLKQHVFFHIFNDDDVIKNAKIEYMKKELATFNNANLFKESFYALSRENDYFEEIFYTLNNYLEGKRKPEIFNHPNDYISATTECNKLNEEYKETLKEIYNSNEYKDLAEALLIKNRKEATNSNLYK